MADSKALPDCVWVCGACGKTSQTRYGGPGLSDRGWDVSCMMNAIHCSKTKSEGKWVPVDEPSSAATFDDAPPQEPAQG
jgi:hypothetical protein